MGGRYLLCALIWLQALAAFAQQNAYISYNTGDGLAQSQVRAIAQDDQGYLWLGTLGGLSRFDGMEFKNYSRENGLPDNQINCLLQGKERFWIGSTGAVCWIEGKAVEKVPFPKNLGSARVLDMVESPEGGLWLALSGEGLLYWHEERFAHFTTDDGLPDNYVRSIEYDAGGALWIGTRSGLVVHNGEQVAASDFAVLSTASVSDLLLSADGAMYVCTFQDRLYKVEANEIRQYTSADGLLNPSIRCAAELPNGEVWFGSVDGLNAFDGKTFSSVREADGLPYANVKSLGTDREGNLWIGTDGQGAMRKAGIWFTTFSTSEGMPSDVAMDMARLSDGRLVIGTYDQGLTVFDGTTFTPFEGNDSLPSKTIWKVERATSDALWVGTSSGLYIWKDGSSKTLNNGDGIPGNRVTALFPEAEKMWVGAENGMALLDAKGKILRTFNAENGFEGKRIRSIYRSGKTLWLGAEGRVIAWDGRELKYLPIPEHQDAAVYCIQSDAYGRLWVGTAAGLYTIEPGDTALGMVPFSPNFGARNINFLAAVGDGTMLAGTNNGLYRLDIDAFHKTSKTRTRHYTPFEGLKGQETNQNAVFVDGEDVWFGTTVGLVLFKPYKDNLNIQVAPKANLTDIQLFLQDVAWDKRPDSISVDNGLPIAPNLKYGENYITFGYTGIYFNNPEKVKYRYKLEGADDAWLGPTKSRAATYAYLPHGDYIFMLQAYSDDDPELLDEVSYSFSIRPPFYLTGWFFLLVGGLIAIVLWGVYQYRIGVEREKRATLQLQFQSRLLELESQTLNSNMNRHFIFNALNSIQYYINMEDKRSANRYLTSFAKLIRMNLDSSQQNLTKLEDELDRLELYLSLEQMRFQGRFDYKISASPDVNLSEVAIPSMMLQPFLENSIWHGILPANNHGHIEVNITQEGDHYAIQIDDNGVGVNTSLLAKAGKENGHVSKGMEITQSRMMLFKRMTGLGYNIEGPDQLENESGEAIGTRVKITLPKTETSSST